MSSQVLFMFRFLCSLSVLENSSSIPGQPFPLKCLCSVFRQLNVKVHLQEAQSSNSTAQVQHVIWRWHKAEESCRRCPGDNEKSMTSSRPYVIILISISFICWDWVKDGKGIVITSCPAIQRMVTDTREPTSALLTHKYGNTDNYRWQELDICRCSVYYGGSFPSLVHWSVTWLLKERSKV